MPSTDATPSPARSRRRATWLVSTLLVGALTLGGCAAGTTGSTTTGSTAASTSAIDTAAPASEATSAASTAETITETTAAAQAFLATLSDEQRIAVVLDYTDDSKSTSWSNFPVTFVERAGLNVNELNAEQQAAAMRVLQALLSDEGYATAAGIIGGDQYLLDNSSTTEDSLGQYYIAFFGAPSDTSAWMLQFGGHHLGVNATLDATTGTVTFAPTHLGSQPAVYTTSTGDQVQPLAGMYADAFAFYDSLTDEQKAALYQGEEVAAMQCAPGSTCTFPTGTGLSGADLTDEQRRLLLAVVANWVGLSDQQTTDTALAEVEATLDQTWISWSGATTYDMSTDDGIYYRISGPDVYIELASQNGSAGADVDGVSTSGWGHIHTIYRDPGNDYAASVAQQEGSGPGGGAGPAGG